MPEKDKKLLERWGHGAAAVTVNCDCVEVILFGGRNKGGSGIADTVVVRFGECFTVPLIGIECYVILEVNNNNKFLLVLTLFFSWCYNFPLLPGLSYIKTRVPSALININC